MCLKFKTVLFLINSGVGKMFKALPSAAGVLKMQEFYKSAHSARMRHREQSGDTALPHTLRALDTFHVAFMRWRDEDDANNNNNDQKNAAQHHERRHRHGEFWTRVVSNVLRDVRQQVALEQQVNLTVSFAFFHDASKQEFASTFAPLRAQFPDIRFIKRTRKTLFDDLDELIHAQMLVAPSSAWTKLVALLQSSGVLLLADAVNQRFANVLQPRPDKRGLICDIKVLFVLT